MISVVSPVYGCTDSLMELCRRTTQVLERTGEDFEIILVDDGDRDGAWSAIEALAAGDPRIRGIRLSRNFGQHHAISAGIEHSVGTHVVVMDCDLQDRPEEIPRLLDTARKGFEVVFAQRIDRRDAVLKRWASRLFYRCLTSLTGVPYDHTIANFGIFSRKVIDTLKRMPESDRCFPLMVKWTGLRSTSIAVDHAERLHGRSSYGIRSLIRLALNIVLSYSDKPLRMVVKLGMLFSLFAFVVAGISIYLYLVESIAVAGYTSIIASIWLMGGVIVFCIGVIGLYVGRLFEDAKRRPHYIVEQRVNFSEG